MIDRKAFHTLTYGLYVIASKFPDGRKVGCIANTFQQVSSDPAQASVALNKDNATTQAILESGRFTASVLSEEATMELIGTFGFHSSLDTDKFSDIAYEIDQAEVPCLKQASIARFSVRVDQTADVGSHLLLIGPVEEAVLFDGQAKPLTYAYYHSVLRGKTPPKAVSYDPGETAAQPATEQKAEGTESGKPQYAWQCTVCGHIEYVDELPDDFTCPICGMGKEMFERIEI